MRYLSLVVDALALALLVALVALVAGVWALGAAGASLLVLNWRYGP